MGGTAYLIHGDLDPARIDSGPQQKTFTEKLLGCLGFRHRPQVVDLKSSRLIELPPGGMIEIAPAFREFVIQRCSPAWTATTAFLDMLDMTVSLRGEQPVAQEQVDWYVQLSFPSGAGTAEVTSQLAWHWAEIWISNHLQDINKTYLRPEGFTASLDRRDQANDLPVFVPVGQDYQVYAALQLMEGESPEFELDECVTESLDDGGEELMSQIQHQLGELMADGQCRCQMCMPDYQKTDSISL
jgi:hypothetical protein